MAIILALFLLFQESPIARKASIYPHPPEPQHLESYQVDLTLEYKVKHWFWTSVEPLPIGAKIEIEQARPKGGWWVSNVRLVGVDGVVITTVKFDTTWSETVLLIWKSDSGAQLSSAEVTAKDRKITGKVLLR